MLPDGLLEAWGIAAGARIAAFGDAPVYRVDAPRGTFVAKDLGPAIDPSRLAFIESVTTHLNANGIPAQAPLRTTDGSLFVEREGKNYVLSTFIDGSSIPGPVDGPTDVMTDVGRQIGRMHRVLAAYPTNDLGTQTWYQDVKKDLPIWLAAVRPKLDGEDLATYDRFERDVLPTAVERLSGLPEQLIHRDCHAGNIVRISDGSFAFIDCDHFCVAPRIFELGYFASGIMSYFADPDALTRWFGGVRALLAGYDDTATLAEREREAFPYAVMSVFAMMAWWFDLTGELEWALSDVRALAGAMDNLAEITRAACGPSRTRP